MTVTRKEIKEFEKLVCKWLSKHGIKVENLSIESHTGVNGYVICWNNVNGEHVVINRDCWDKYIGNIYDKIRREDLQILKRCK
ncbi:MAG: hypothetical protein WAT71_07585 [Ignavibacteria bacterium]